MQIARSLGGDKDEYDPVFDQFKSEHVFQAL